MPQHIDTAQTRQISEKIVAGLPTPDTGNKLHYFSGSTLQGKKAPSGFAVRVTSAGTKSFVLFHRFEGKGYLETLGRWDENAGGGTLTVRDAIVKADKLAKDLKNGRREDPRPERTRRLEDGNTPEGMTVGDLLDQFVSRYVEREANLRSASAIKSALDNLVKPAIGKLGIYEIRRSNVITMLDDIADGKGGKEEDRGGPVEADRVLAYIRKAFNWWAARDDEFTPPIIKGMARTKPKERARKRVLADDEIRDLWSALDSVKDISDAYRGCVKTLLLTATRLNEAARMSASEIDGDVWVIPASRYKTKLDHAVPLTEAARAAIGKVEKDGFVFSTSAGKRAINGFAKVKTAIDREIARIRKEAGRAPMPAWVFHDLRRTGRSLMSRAKVDSDHAERALGHVMGGVRETYDRHSYIDEKRAAFEALAALVDRILNPQNNVSELRRAGQ
jgi:integrase